MNKRVKTLERMLCHPRDWRINDLLTVAQQYGISVRNNGGSNYVFTYPGIEEDVCVPAHRPIKPVYIHRFIALITQIEEINQKKTRIQNRSKVIPPCPF